MNSSYISRRQPQAHWHKSLRAVLAECNKMVHDGSKRAGDSTQAERAEILMRGFRQLHALGYAIRDVHSFRTKHFQALLNYWLAQQYKPATLQKYISVFRVFAGWIGKSGLIGDSATLVPNACLVQRRYATERDKSWSAAEVDVREKLREVTRVDALVGLQLEMQLAFGLRLKEACLLRPHLADNHTFLAVNWGTKGGRHRIVPIDTEYKRALVERAKRAARRKHDSLVPANISWIAWRNHFYYVCRKTHITRADGITSHGLRHEYMNDLFEQLTGEKSPVRGGRKQDIPKEDLKRSQQIVAEHAGHGRPQITSAYTGSYQQPRRTKKQPSSEAQAQLPLPWEDA
jgi:integrase